MINELAFLGLALAGYAALGALWAWRW